MNNKNKAGQKTDYRCNGFGTPQGEWMTWLFFFFTFMGFFFGSNIDFLRPVLYRPPCLLTCIGTWGQKRIKRPPIK